MVKVWAPSGQDRMGDTAKGNKRPITVQSRMCAYRMGWPGGHTCTAAQDRTPPVSAAVAEPNHSENDNKSRNTKASGPAQKNKNSEPAAGIGKQSVTFAANRHCRTALTEQNRTALELPIDGSSSNIGFRVRQQASQSGTLLGVHHGERDSSACLPASSGTARALITTS